MTQRYNLIGGGLSSLLAAAAALILALPVGVAAQDGTITGSVNAATTGQPINGTQISVMDTQLGGLSNVNGRFLITRVPPGTYTVQAVHVGYGTQTQQVTVSSGGSATIEFSLEVSAVDLDEIIVTGTAGAVERRKLGVSAASLDVASISETVPLDGFSQALEGRIPGVRSIGSVGGVGAGRVLTVRGMDSFQLGQRPVIYIDGIRVDTRGSEWGSGTNNTSMRTTCCAFSGGAGEDRLSDLNPDEIDRVEVLKGPAAATLYGSEASGGVIQIFTKRGRNNTPAQFTFSSSVGINRHRANFPTSLRSNFRGADGTVALDPNESLIENGLINSYDLTVDGGGGERDVLRGRRIQLRRGLDQAQRSEAGQPAAEPQLDGRRQPDRRRHLGLRSEPNLLASVGQQLAGHLHQRHADEPAQRHRRGALRRRVGRERGGRQGPPDVLGRRPLARFRDSAVQSEAVLQPQDDDWAGRRR